MTEIIQLISGPRNISTALMYSFLNRADTTAVDEPFYAYYLKKYFVDYHPGRQEILESQNSNPQKVIEEVLFAERPENYLFVKNMAHHMIGFDYSYSKQVRNIFLIRNPRHLITSFAKVIEHPTGVDIGIEREYELFEEMKNNDSPIAVIDSGELLKNPINVLNKLCQQIQIPWDEDMLEWLPGKRKEDGAWAKYWYESVHKSTKFQKQKSSENPLEDRLIPLLEEVKPYYDLLFNEAIKA